MPDTIQILRLGAVTSTLDEARVWARQHTGSRGVIVASEQTHGRGRHGRSWYSPEGGCWMTVIWPGLPPEMLGLGGLLGAVAVAETVDLTIGHRPGPGAASGAVIRWPNDVLVEERKIAGVLGEAFDGVFMVGVGVNVNNTLPDQSMRTDGVALADLAGSTIDLDAFVDALARKILGMLGACAAGQTAPQLALIERRLAWRGEDVTLTDGARTESGRVAGVAPDGRLRLLQDGAERLCAAGELSCRRVL